MRKKGIDIIEKKDKKDLPGYPVYPPEEDIYTNAVEEEEIDPELILQQQEPGKKTKKIFPKNNFADKPDKGLDLPGTELDDEQEEIGNEDEENNYYSLGGEGHESLEEDQGDNY